MDITLRLDVNEKDAEKMILWLSNQNITKYLNEDINSIEAIEKVIEKNQTELFTYYLNQDGRFFLIDLDEECIGFVNLFTIRSGKEYEVVIAIGDQENWGKHYAKKALESIMRKVFITWRIDRLKAKICLENNRSIGLFDHLNFRKIKISEKFISYEITMDGYIELLKSRR